MDGPTLFGNEGGGQANSNQSISAAAIVNLPEVKLEPLGKSNVQLSLQFVSAAVMSF